MSCGNSDILALIDYFQNGTDLSNNNWDNYNYYDLWNAIENGATPPERTVCATFVQADIRSIVFAVLGVFTSPSDYLGDNIDFYYLYLKSIGQEVVSPTFSNFCVGQLYNVFSIGLTAKFRQGQDFNVTMSKVAAIASITFEQGQQLDALLSKSAALQQVVFQQKQTFNVDLTTYAYLLDDYSGAAAAYSIRLLSSTYTGPLVQIRKQGDNAINSFYPDSNNELSLNSEDGAGTSLGTWIGSDDGFIRTWFDQSGNANNAVQNSAANQPKFINTGALIIENGKPAIELNPSSTPNLVFNANLTQPFSYINLITPSDVSLPNPYILDGVSRIIIGYRSNKFMIYAGAFLERAGATSSQHLRSSVFNGANSILKNNGSILVTGNAGVSNATTAYIGGNFVSALAYTQENIFYDSDKSPDFAGIETNINDFYSIY